MLAEIRYEDARNMGGSRDERVARPLREQPEVGGDECAATHPAGSQQIHPTPLLRFLLELERRANLCNFTLYELALGVAFGVVLDEDLLGLFDAVVGDQPSRGLRKKEHEDALDDRGRELEERRDSPRPVVRDAVGSENDAGGDELTDEVRDVEQRSEDRTFLGVTEFTDKRGTGDDASGDTETENQTGDDVHGNYQPSDVSSGKTGRKLGR